MRFTGYQHSGHANVGFGGMCRDSREPRSNVQIGVAVARERIRGSGDFVIVPTPALCPRMDTFDDLDEPTQPFTHTQIGKMLNAAEVESPRPRTHEVDLEYFMGFGESGTPAGMIGSWERSLIAGWCGDPPKRGRSGEIDYPWGPAPSGLSESGPVPAAAGVAVATALASPPAPVAATAPVASGVAELTVVASASLTNPGVTPAELPREAANDPGTALEEDLRGAGLRRGGWMFAGLALLIAAGVTIAVWPRAEPEVEVPDEELIVITTPDIPQYDDEAFGPTPGDAAGEPVAETGADETANEDEDEDEDTRKSSSSGEPPRWKTPPCARTRDDAKQAKEHGEWKSLDKLAREYKCWRRGWEAKVLRMQACFELGRHDDCMKIGEGSKHPQIGKWYNLCSRARR